MYDFHWVWPHKQSCSTTKILIKNCTIQTRCLYETLICQQAILAHDNLTKPNNLRIRSPDSFRPGRQSAVTPHNNLSPFIQANTSTLTLPRNTTEHTHARLHSYVYIHNTIYLHKSNVLTIFHINSPHTREPPASERTRRAFIVTIVNVAVVVERLSEINQKVTLQMNSDTSHTYILMHTQHLSTFFMAVL